MRLFILILLNLALAAFLGADGSPASFPMGEPFKPGKLPKAEQDALRPGLLLRFFANPTGKDPLDTRRSRLAVFHVPAGTPPSPWLAPGPFTARLNGYLKVPLRGTFNFKIEGTGNAVLDVNGRTLLKMIDGVTPREAPADLVKGYNRIDIVFTSPPRGDATLRVFWNSENFVTEPLPPDAMFSRGDDPGLIQGQMLREGRFLYATLGCARCHTLPGNVAAKNVAMPEMAQTAPSLKDAGKRFHIGWLARWIADPCSLRPDATMPKVLHGATAQQDAVDIANYLAALGAGSSFAAHAATDDLVKQGEKLFDKVGCIACHRLSEPREKDETGRLSLFFVKAKFRAGALTAFLKQPHEHYPWTRMPDFKLEEKEARALTSFLEKKAAGAIARPAKNGDAQRGEKLFQSVGCAACHAVNGKEERPPAKLPALAREALAKGCLAEDAARRGQAPEFALKKPGREALQAFLATDSMSLRRQTMAEFSLRQVEHLQCRSCHRRDGALTRWHQVLEEDGSQPEFLPPLTWAGEKLKPEWTTRLLKGLHSQRARPWLKARMPAFPVRAEGLSIGLSHEHGYGDKEDARPKPDPALAEIGKKLLAAQGGFNCIMCHGVGKQPPVAPFEAPGINLVDAALRLRYAYYPRWMIDPPRVDVTTRMVKLAQDGHTTPLRDVLGGDARKQFDAIWHHLQTLPEGNLKDR